MPPKKFREPNTKSVAAKERKAAARREEEERRRKEEEDEYWRDDDKYVMRKQDRKSDKEKKKQDQIDKKAELKRLLEAEESSLKGKQVVSSKVTKSQIAEAKISSTGATPLPKGVVEIDPLTDNPNHLMIDRKLEGYYDAETIDEAIEVLSVGKDDMDRHPERRLKAAYAAFEERELPKMKLENPNLRMSQIKQLLRKEWMKSKDNPLNQPHKSYNEKI